MSPTKTHSPEVHHRSSGYNVNATLLDAQSPAIRARAIFPIYAKTTVALVRAAYHHAPMKIRSKFLRSSWQCTWRCKNV